MSEIRRAVAFYGLLIDEYSLAQKLSANTEFVKHLLSSDDHDKMYSFINESLKHSHLEWTKKYTSSEASIYIIGLEISKMKDNQTFEEFKKDIDLMLRKIINCDFTCDIYALPREDLE